MASWYHVQKLNEGLVNENNDNKLSNLRREKKEKKWEKYRH